MLSKTFNLSLSKKKKKKSENTQNPVPQLLFSCKLCENFKLACFAVHLRIAASKKVLNLNGLHFLRFCYSFFNSLLERISHYVIINNLLRSSFRISVT